MIDWAERELRSEPAWPAARRMAAMLHMRIDSFRRVLRVVTLLAVLNLSGISTALAQQVAVLVDGEPITELDIAQRLKFTEMSTHKTPTRQEVIDQLINEILEIRE